MIKILLLLILPFCFMGCGKEEIIKECPIPQNKDFWFPYSSGSILIYGHPCDYQIVNRFNLIISKDQLPLLCSLLAKKEPLSLKDMAELLYNDSKGIMLESAIIVEIHNYPLSCDGSKVNVNQYQIYHKNEVVLSIFRLKQVPNGNVKISLFSKEELKQIGEKINLKLVSQKYSVSFLPRFFLGGAYWQQFSSLFDSSALKINEKIVYANYKFPVNKIYKSKDEFIYIFSKGLGLIATYAPKDIVSPSDTLYYKDFFVELKGDAKTRLMSRLIYYYIPGKDKDFEFIDRHFFEKSPSGELMTKKIDLSL